MANEKNELTPADQRLVDQHAETAGLLREQADLEALLGQPGDERLAAMEEAAGLAEANLDADLRERGERGRGPLPTTDQRRALTAFQEERENAKVRLRAIPALLARIKKRLADDLLMVRQAEPVAAQLNANLQTVAGMARQLVELNKTMVGQRRELDEAGRVASRSWSIDWQVGRGETNLVHLVPGLIELASVIERADAQVATAERKAAGQPNEAEQIDAMNREAADYRKAVQQALVSYRKTRKGAKEFALLRQCNAAIAQRDDGKTFSDEMASGWRQVCTAACEAANLPVRVDEFDFVKI